MERRYNGVVMKIWKKYSQYLRSGEWHIHTNYTDGINSVDDYCKRATELGIPLVAFTEHIRRKTNYDYQKYLEDIDSARKQYDLVILSGCEAKVLPDGNLDVDDEVLQEIDYPIFAFHSFPRNLDIYVDALYNVLDNPHVNTWAHPGLFLRKMGLYLCDEEMHKIFRKLKDNEVLIEINAKYKLPNYQWVSLARQYQVECVRGSDCHNVNELVKSTEVL